MDSTITEKKYLAWMHPDGYSTMRFVVDPGQILYTQAKDGYLEDDNCDITHPDLKRNWMMTCKKGKDWVVRSTYSEADRAL